MQTRPACRPDGPLVYACFSGRRAHWVAAVGADTIMTPDRLGTVAGSRRAGSAEARGG